MLESMKNKKVEKSEELILNVISLLTNMLFYDTPSKEIVTDVNLKREIFKFVLPHVFASQNEEMQVESVRVLSNLSRHPVGICF